MTGYSMSRFSDEGTCAVINEVLVKHRRHAGNITANPAARGQTLEETLIVLGT